MSFPDCEDDAKFDFPLEWPLLLFRFPSVLEPGFLLLSRDPPTDPSALP